MTSFVNRFRYKFWGWVEAGLNENRRARYITAVQLDPTAQFGPEATVENLFKDPSRISIGAHSYVRGRLLTHKHGGRIKIGEWCYVGARSEIWSMTSITIGDRVLIAHDVNIHDGTAHSTDDQERHAHYQQIVTQGHPRTLAELPGISSTSIVIEDDVWISFGVTILKGVRIGQGSVIAAGAMVLDDVPPYTFYRCEVKSILSPLKQTSQQQN